MLSESEFFACLREILRSTLPLVLGTLSFEFVQGPRHLQIRLDGFRGCHYEIIFQRNKQRKYTHNIAIHFEGSVRLNEERLASFKPHLDDLRQTLEMEVRAGAYQSSGWTQVYIENPLQPLSELLAYQYAVQTLRFVAATLPILVKTYGVKVE